MAPELATQGEQVTVPPSPSREPKGCLSALEPVRKVVRLAKKELRLERKVLRLAKKVLRLA